MKLSKTIEKICLSVVFAGILLIGCPMNTSDSDRYRRLKAAMDKGYWNWAADIATGKEDSLKKANPGALYKYETYRASYYTSKIIKYWKDKFNNMAHLYNFIDLNDDYYITEIEAFKAYERCESMYGSPEK